MPRINHNNAAFLVLNTGRALCSEKLLRQGFFLPFFKLFFCLSTCLPAKNYHKNTVVFSPPSLHFRGGNALSGDVHNAALWRCAPLHFQRGAIMLGCGLLPWEPPLRRSAYGNTAAHFFAFFFFLSGKRPAETREAACIFSKTDARVSSSSSPTACM